MDTGKTQFAPIPAYHRRFIHRLHPRDYSLKFRDYLWIAMLWILAVVLRTLFCILVLAGTSSIAAAQESAKSSVFSPGETLQYKVKWGFFRLGTIVISQQPCDTAQRGGCVVTMRVQSARGLPFINVHFVNSSRKTPVALWVSEETIITGEDTSEFTVYRYDSSNGYLYCRNSTRERPVPSNDSVRLEGRCYDALGLLMLARTFGPASGTMTIPTLNEFSIHETEIRFTGEKEEVKAAACDSPVRCRRIEGCARWVGNSFAGMKGPFTGWISDDDAAIPVRAELGIFLGSIVLELESTNRTDWRQDKLAASQDQLH